MKKVRIGKRAIIVRDENHFISDAVNVGKGIVKEAGKAVKTDVVLIRTRDKIISTFVKNKIPQAVMDAALIKNKLRHADIPNRKIGGTYDKEFAALYQYVIDVFNGIKRSDLAELFQRTIPVYTPATHDTQYVADLLAGKIRAVPEPIGLKEQTTQLANEKVQASENEMREFNPAKTETQSAKVLKPFAPIMRAGLSNAGFNPPTQIDALATMFYTEIVQPGTQSNYDVDYIDDAVVESILHFIATLQSKKANGEQLNKTYTAIAETADKLTNKGEQIARGKVDSGVGKFVTDNIAVIGLGVAALVFFALRK